MGQGWCLNSNFIFCILIQVGLKSHLHELQYENRSSLQTLEQHKSHDGCGVQRAQRQRSGPGPLALVLGWRLPPRFGGPGTDLGAAFCGLKPSVSFYQAIPVSLQQLSLVPGCAPRSGLGCSPRTPNSADTNSSPRILNTGPAPAMPGPPE